MDVYYSLRFGQSEAGTMSRGNTPGAVKAAIINWLDNPGITSVRVMRYMGILPVWPAETFHNPADVALKFDRWVKETNDQ
jgi:hypothetical protein